MAQLAKFLNKLKTEIADDPQGYGYSTMTNQEIADKLNLADIVQYRRVPLSEIQDWASTKRLYKIIVDKGLEGGSLHKELDFLLSGKQQDANVNSEASGVSGLINDLINAEVITTTDAGELQEMGKRYVSRAQELVYNREITLEWINRVKENL